MVSIENNTNIGIQASQLVQNKGLVCLVVTGGVISKVLDNGITKDICQFRLSSHPEMAPSSIGGSVIVK